jgi:hypothetical protein
MSIAFRAAGTVTTGTTAITSMPEPSGTATGDCLVALILDHATTGTTTAPTGWTRQGGAAGTGGRFQVFTAIVGQGGLTGTTWTWSSLTTTCEGVILGFTGVDPANPIDSVTPSARVNASGTKGTTAITPNTANDMIIAAFAALASGSTLATPTLTDPASGSLALAVNQSNSTHSTLAAWYGLQTTASTTGASGITMGTAGINAAITLALRPCYFAHVQGTVSGVVSSGTTMSVTLSAAPTLGDMVCVGMVFQGATLPTTCTVVDANGNVYTVTPNSPSSAQFSSAGAVFLAYLLEAPINASATITATFNQTIAAGTIRAEEFSLSSGYSATLDTDIVGSGTTGTAINSPSITPASATELLYSCAVPGHSITSANSPWTQDAAGIDANGCDGEYILSSASGATAVNYTVNISGPWGAMVMAIAAVTVSLRECMLMGIGF